MRKPFRRLFSMLAASLIVTVSPHANAAIIDSISNLDINGTAYDVTFHTDSVSFNDLWDADDDGIFGGGGSVFATQPTFWLDLAAANAARDAVAAALGTVDGWHAISDSFFVPCGIDLACLTSINRGFNPIAAASENNTRYNRDITSTEFISDNTITPGTSGRRAYASFSPSASAPAPITPALLIPGLVAIAGIRKRRKKASN